MPPRITATAALITLVVAAFAAAIAARPSPPQPAQRAYTGGTSTPKQGGNPARPPFLLISEGSTPSLEIAWQTNFGWADRSLSVPFASPAAKAPIAENLSVYLALGGTRLEKGAGDPAGAIVRVGFYKRDPAKPLLADPADGALVRVRLRGVRFNQPVDAQPRTLLQHMNYSDDALDACGAPSRLADIFITANPDDDLSARIGDPRAVRGGFFAVTDRIDPPDAAPPPVPPERSSSAKAAARVEPDGSVTLDAIFPYSAFRHTFATLQPPTPGNFAEPDHFHLEFQVVPADRRPPDAT